MGILFEVLRIRDSKQQKRLYEVNAVVTILYPQTRVCLESNACELELYTVHLVYIAEVNMVEIVKMNRLIFNCNLELADVGLSVN